MGEECRGDEEHHMPMSPTLIDDVECGAELYAWEDEMKQINSTSKHDEPIECTVRCHKMADKMAATSARSSTLLFVYNNRPICHLCFLMQSLL